MHDFQWQQPECPGLRDGYVNTHGGEGGIRTHERLETPTRFPGAPVRPLQHLSIPAIGILMKIYLLPPSRGRIEVGGGTPILTFPHRRGKGLLVCSLPLPSLIRGLGKAIGNY